MGRRLLVTTVYVLMAGAVVVFCAAPQLVGVICALVVAALVVDAASYLV